MKALGPAGDRGRPVEPDMGQMEWAKCPIRSFNDSWAGATCHCEQGGGRKMSQFVSKWLCNSRVLSSRDKGHPIILGKGIRISGKQAQRLSRPPPPPHLPGICGCLKVGWGGKASLIKAFKMIPKLSLVLTKWFMPISITAIYHP